MNSTQSNLQVEISYRQILKIALPIGIAILIPQLNFLINNIFLAHYDEQTVLGVAGVTGVYYLIFSSVGNGLNNGMQTLISRRAGANDPGGIGKYYGQGVWVAIMLSLIGVIVTYTIFPIIIRLFITDEKTVNLAIQFMRIRIWGLPFLYFFQMRNALMVGTNNSRYLPIGTASETAVNIALDYALIFGHWGFPELGFMGAAYASIATEITGMAVTYFIIAKTGIRQRFNIRFGFIFDKQLFKEIMAQSGPLMFQHAISIMVWFFFFLLLGGTAQHHTNLAISNTMRNVFGLFGVVTWALGSTTNTMISNVIGQDRVKELPIIWRKLIITSVSSAILVAGLLLLFPDVLFGLFTSNAALVSNAIPVIRVVATAMIVMSISIVCLSTVIGAGYTKLSLLAEIGSTFIYCLYTWYVIKHLDAPLHWAWANELQYWGCLLLFTYGVIRFKIFKNIALGVPLK